MHLSNSILSTLDIDSSEFFYKSDVTLYDKEKENPFGIVTFENGHYRLTVGKLAFAPVRSYE